MATTFGRKGEGSKAFQEVPLTSQAAKAKGWTLLSSCEGKFSGIRYTNSSEPSLVAIYDVNDIIAGLQAVVLEKDLNSSAIENFGKSNFGKSQFGKPSTIYTKDLWLGGEPAFFSTVLFTDPNAICNDKVKTTLEGGIGDRVVVLYDNGYFLEVPISEERAAEIDRKPFFPIPENFPPLRSAPSWKPRKCRLGMGLHLIDSFDYTSPCGRNPVQGLYDKGDLIGFAWNVWSIGGANDRPQGNRWEDPTTQEIQDAMKL